MLETRCLVHFCACTRLTKFLGPSSSGASPGSGIIQRPMWNSPFWEERPDSPLDYTDTHPSNLTPTLGLYVRSQLECDIRYHWVHWPLPPLAVSSMSALLRPAVGCGRSFPEEQRRPKLTSYITPTSHPAEGMSALELSRQSLRMNRWYSWKRVFQWRFSKNLLLLFLICLAHIGYRPKIFN